MERTIPLELLIRLQVYIISLAVLSAIYIQLKYEVQILSRREKAFKYLALTMMIPLVLETLTWVMNGRPGRIAWLVHMGLDVFLFALHTIPLAIWLLYVILTIEPKEEVLGKRYMPVIILVAINMLIALSTPITNKYFIIDVNNIYHRGEWTVISNGIFGLLLSYNFWLILRNWEKINQRDRVPMLFFLLPPMMGFVFQMMFFGTSLVWPSCTISILIVYIMIQSQIVKTDYLTGLYNRRQLDFYLNRKICSLPDHEAFAGIMIDLDDFKGINDEWGHKAGDSALRNVAILLNKTFHRNAFIARYGGDEFIVLVNIKDEKILKELIRTLKSNFELFNKKSKENYQLHISVGYSMYTSEYRDTGGFFNHLDQLMYKNKKKRKTLLLRKTGVKQIYHV